MPTTIPDEDPDHAEDAFEGSEFQSRPGYKMDGWYTPRWCADVSKNPTEARVLAQLAYWFGISRKTGRCRARIVADGYYWIYKQYSQLARETGLSRKQVGDAMRAFQSTRVVVTRTDTRHGRLVRIDPIVISEMLRTRADAE